MLLRDIQEPCMRKSKISAQELLRPWKLFSLASGITLLIIGSYHYNAPDWDVTFSIIQAIETYVTAAWSMRIILDRKLSLLPAALFAIWFTVDGSYWIYWHFKDPVALAFMRDVNFLASLSLYLGMGIVWMWNGSLREFFGECRKVFFLKE